MVKLLVRQPWDVSRYEQGGENRRDDRYRCDEFLNIAMRCLEVAKYFRNFRGKEWFQIEHEQEEEPGLVGDIKEENDLVEKEDAVKVKTEGNVVKKGDVAKVKLEENQPKQDSDTRAFRKNGRKHLLLEFALMYHDLKRLVEIEEDKTSAPPPSISFTG